MLVWKSTVYCKKSISVCSGYCIVQGILAVTKLPALISGGQAFLHYPVSKPTFLLLSIEGMGLAHRGGNKGIQPGCHENWSRTHTQTQTYAHNVGIKGNKGFRWIGKKFLYDLWMLPGGEAG